MEVVRNVRELTAVLEQLTEMTDADASRKTATGADADAKTEPETVPAHHDPVRLREAYETCETFKEMTDALGVDVTPQTVRNQMIQRGIHEPDSYGPSSEPASSGGTSDGDDEVRNSEPSVADAEDATESEPAPEPSPKPESNAAPDADADAESVASRVAVLARLLDGGRVCGSRGREDAVRSRASPRTRPRRGP